jgi:hypothetical protein
MTKQRILPGFNGADCSRRFDLPDFNSPHTKHVRGDAAGTDYTGWSRRSEAVRAGRAAQSLRG